MSTPLDPKRRVQLLKAFRMPKAQTPVSRKSSVTNAFVNAVIPVVQPTAEEIAEALDILKLDPVDLQCAYCGNVSTEWDHLRPLVLNRRPTGYISEIANLVPACGKCNQSKRNEDWREWMQSGAKHSPTGRGIADVSQRIETISAFTAWRKPRRVDFVALLGEERWEHYWSLCEAVVEEMKESQEVADAIKAEVSRNL